MTEERTLAIYIVLGEPTFEWCDVCQFNELATFPVTSISVIGVGSFGTLRRCLRCNQGGA